LIHFWQESFKVQVETRSGALRLHEVECESTPFRCQPNTYYLTIDESPIRQPKRRKINRKLDAENAIGHLGNEEIQPDVDNNMDYDMNWDYGKSLSPDSIFSRISIFPRQQSGCCNECRQCGPLTIFIRSTSLISFPKPTDSHFSLGTWTSTSRVEIRFCD
jgi:hypothetical protein